MQLHHMKGRLTCFFPPQRIYKNGTIEMWFTQPLRPRLYIYTYDGAGERRNKEIVCQRRRSIFYGPRTIWIILRSHFFHQKYSSLFCLESKYDFCIFLINNYTTLSLYNMPKWYTPPCVFTVCDIANKCTFSLWRAPSRVCVDALLLRDAAQDTLSTHT